jgi:hypothetical protein
MILSYCLALIKILRTLLRRRVLRAKNGLFLALRENDESNAARVNKGKLHSALVCLASAVIKTTGKE